MYKYGADSGGHGLNKLWLLQVDLLPGPYPAFYCLQYGKAGKACMVHNLK